MSTVDENEYKDLNNEPEKEQVVTDQAIYNMVLYLPLDELDLRENASVSYIIERAREYTEDQKVEINENILEALESVDKDNSCLDATISNMSFNCDDELVRNPDAFSAAVFTLNGESSINFRGTPSKAWMDNADNLNGCSGNTYTANGNTWNYLSDIDIATLKYIESFSDDELNQYIVSGHSKGGHEALLVALVYPECVRSCYVFDGQSISPEMWDEIKQIYSDNPERLEAIREKINAINVENDYVHPLGWTEVDGYIAHNIYTIKGNAECDTNPLASHYIQSFFSIENDMLKLNEAIDNKNLKDKEGPLAEFLKQVSNRIMKLHPEQRKPVTDSIMAICQAAIGRDFPVDYSSQEYNEIIANMDNGMTTACLIFNDVLINTDEGSAFINYLNSFSDVVVKSILSFVRNHPFFSIGAVTVIPVLLSALLDLFALLNHTAEDLVFIKNFSDALMNNVANTPLSTSGWLHEKKTAVYETSRKVIHGEMTGRVGIDYAMIQRARRQIEEFTDDATRLERMIDDILSDLSTLRYANVSTEQLREARTQITKQKNYMNVHSDDLKAYEDACRKTEEGFITALHEYN